MSDNLPHMDCTDHRADFPGCTVTDNDYVIQHLGVQLEGDIQRSPAVHRNLLCEVTHKAHLQDTVGGYCQ